jgi:hypothetical protein
MQKAYYLFGLRGAQAIAILVKSITDNKFQKALDNTYEFGAAASMMAKQAEGLSFRASQLASRLGVLGVKLGEAGIGASIGTLIDLFRKAASALIWFSKDGIGQAITSITMFSLVLYGLVKALTILAAFSWVVLARNIWAYAMAWQMLGVSMSNTAKIWAMVRALFISNIWGLITVGVIALSVALYRLSTVTERNIKKMEEDLESRKQQLGSLKTYIAALEDIKKREEKGIDVAEEKKSLIRYLTEEHKYLSEEVVKAGGNIDKLTEAMKKVAKEQFEKKLSEQVEILKQYVIQLDLAKKGLLEIAGFKFKVRDKDSEKSIEKINGLQQKQKEGIWEIINSLMEEKKATNESDKSTTAKFVNLLTNMRVSRREFSLWLAMFKSVLALPPPDLLKGIPKDVKEALAKIHDLNMSLLDLKDTIDYFESEAKTFHTQDLIELYTAYYNKRIELERKLTEEKKNSEPVEAKKLKMDYELLETEHQLNLEREAAIDKAIKKGKELEIQDSRNVMTIKQTKKEITDLGDKDLQVREKIINELNRLQETLDETRKVEKEYLGDTQKDREKLLEELSKEKQLIEEMQGKYKELADAQLKNDTDVVASREKLIEKEKEMALLVSKGSYSKTELDALKKTVDVLNKEYVVAQIAAIEKLKEHNWMVTEQGIDYQLTTEQIQGYNDQLERLYKNLQGMKSEDLLGFAEKGTIRVIDGLADSLARMASGANSVKESFRDMAESIINDIMRVIAKYIILLTLQKATGFFGFGGASKFLGGMIGTMKEAGTIPMGLPGGNMATSPVAAGAARMMGGMPGMAGGLFGMPKMASAGAGEGGGGGNTFIINATDAQSFVNMMKTKSSQEAISDIVTNKVSHNSPLRSMMGNRRRK